MSHFLILFFFLSPSFFFLWFIFTPKHMHSKHPTIFFFPLLLFLSHLLHHGFFSLLFPSHSSSSTTYTRNHWFTLLQLNPKITPQDLYPSNQIDTYLKITPQNPYPSNQINTHPTIWKAHLKILTHPTKSTPTENHTQNWHPSNQIIPRWEMWSINEFVVNG